MNEEKSRFLYSFVFVCALLLVGVGVSYAYFTAQVNYTNGVQETKVVTGNMSIVFETSRYINNPLMLLVKDENVASEAEHIDFTVAHSEESNTDATYNVSLVDLALSDNFKTADLKWQLLNNGYVIANGDFAEIGDATSLLLNSTPLTLNVGDENEMIVRLWLSETEEDQSNLFNGRFSGKVQITAVHVAPTN